MYKMILKKEKLKNVNKENLEVFFHLIRIINALRSTMKKQVKLAQNEDNIEGYKDDMDMLFVNIGLFYEGIRKYFQSLDPRVPNSYISKDDRKALNLLHSRFIASDDDDFMKIAKIIRDKVAFHFDLDVVSHNITNDEPTNDLVIGYTTSDAIKDCVYIEPYTSIFMYLANNCPEDIEDIDRLSWIRENAIAEIHDFCLILERICNGFFKRNGMLVEGDISQHRYT